MFSIKDFKRLIAPLQRKIFLLAGRALLSIVNNDESTQKLMITVLNNETINDVERFQEYGFETYPLEDSEPFVIFLNGNRDHGFALCVHDRRYRPTDLSEGEVAMYTDEDSTTPFRFWLKRDRIAYLKADKLQAVLDTEAYINSDRVILGDDAWASVLRLVDERFKDLFNNHVHSGVTAGGASTGVPTTQISEASHMTDKTRAV